MPTYEYTCHNCGKDFSLVMSMAEHSRKKVKCPACQSQKVIQQFSTFYAKTSRKS